MNYLYSKFVIVGFSFKPGARRANARSWFLEIAFVRDVAMCVRARVCVSAPEAINYIYVISRVHNKYKKRGECPTVE